MSHVRTIPFLSFTAMLLAACHKDDVRSSGHITTEVRAVGTFTDVRIEGPIDVDIRQGATHRVAVRTDVNALGRVRTNVVGGVLVLALDEAQYGPGLRFSVMVDMPTIGRLTQNGVSDTHLSGFHGVPGLEVISNGVGDLTLHGSTRRLHITQHGVGRINAEGFAADTCQVGLSGVGNVEVRVSALLHGYLSGVGSIHYHGSPVVQVDDTGVGNVVRLD